AGGSGGGRDGSAAEGATSGWNLARRERDRTRRRPLEPPRSDFAERTIPGSTSPRCAATTERLRRRCLPPAGGPRARIQLLEPPRRLRKRTSVLPVRERARDESGA